MNRIRDLSRGWSRLIFLPAGLVGGYKKINALIQERLLKDQQFREADKRARDLADAQRTIDEFLRQERNEQQQNRKRKKNGDLEWVCDDRYLILLTPVTL